MFSEEAKAKRLEATVTHGHTRNGKITPTYRAWFCMKQRCNNPHNASYARYGGRGIKVCDRWNESFEAFLEDMGEIPEGLSVDRKNSNGNYEPGNVRYATYKEQANNTSYNRMLTINGETRNLTQWAEFTGLPVTTIWNRVEAGWKPEDCILPANSTRCVYLTAFGRTQTIAEWAREVGMSSPKNIAQRIERGWSVEDAVSTPPRKTRKQSVK